MPAEKNSFLNATRNVMSNSEKKKSRKFDNVKFLENFEMWPNIATYSCHRKKKKEDFLTVV